MQKILNQVSKEVKERATPLSCHKGGSRREIPGEVPATLLPLCALLWTLTANIHSRHRFAMIKYSRIFNNFSL